MEKEILRLFKGYLGEKTEVCDEKALKFGLLIPNSANEQTVNEAIKQYGKDGKQWNRTFHKDFEIVKNAPIEDLIVQQLIHYITTYGFEELGIFNNDTVYMPKEKLEIPELEEDIELITISALNESELTEKLMVLLKSGIALSEQTVKDIMVLSDYIDKNRFDEISNREVKIALYDKYNVMPRNPDEFLRYLLFKTTGCTLKIKNKDMIDMIKDSDKKLALSMLNSYVNMNGYDKLSSIFLRNKNLFLAFKIKKSSYEGNTTTRTNINKLINRLRKLANDNHKPLSKNILDCLSDEMIDVDLIGLPLLLDKITIFREIRILNGLLYRLNGNNSIVYKIRNGKSFTTTLDNKTEEYCIRLEGIIEVVKNHLNNRLKKQVKGKTIYIPNNVTYAAPTSEKQFNNNFPEGSYIEVPRDSDLVYGIYWKNLINNESKRVVNFYGSEITSAGEERVDLDVKQMNKNEIFGWDASYRSSTSDIYFSGDLTNAPLPDGSSELFYVGQNYGHGAFIVTVNNYTSNSEDVPFEFVIAKADNKPAFKSYHVLNPNNILAKIDMVSKVNSAQMIAGFIAIGDTIRFYFNDFSNGNSCTSSQNDIMTNTFDYLQSYNKTQLKLNDLLKDAGAIIVDKPTIEVKVIKEQDGEKTIEIVEEQVDIDLSPNVITKESIIKLLSE